MVQMKKFQKKSRMTVSQLADKCQQQMAPQMKSNIKTFKVKKSNKVLYDADKLSWAKMR